jgi:cyanophycin synthetase
MKIESIKAINGANVYSRQPVLVMRLDLDEQGGKESRDFSDFNVRLLELLPGLRKHFCDYGKAGGFVKRLHKGTHFNHVIEHIALELMARAGFDERHKKVCGGNENDDSKAVLETTTVEMTRYLLPVATEFADALVNEKSYFLEEKITEAKNIAADTELGLSASNRCSRRTSRHSVVERE